MATREELSTALKNLSAATREEFGSYAFAVGFYESVLANVVASLPASQQDVIMSQLTVTTEKYTKETV